MSAIDWESVPAEFHYLNNLVLQNRLNDLFVVPWVKELGRPAGLAERTSIGIDGLTSDELADLARVHREICKREDNLHILVWIEQALTSDDDATSASWVQRFLDLLRELATFGIRPFSEHAIVSEVVRRPTWENLPEDLLYLKDAIEKYCSQLSDDAGPIERSLRFVRRFKRWRLKAKREMRELGERVVQDRARVKAWYQQFKRTPEGYAFLDLEMMLVDANAVPDDFLM